MPAPVEERQPAPDGSPAGENASADKEQPTEPEEKLATAVPVKADANPQAKSIAEALKTKTHPERLSAMLPPKAFDADAFARNPDLYTQAHEPGRVFQAAQPGRDVPALRAEGSRFHALKQGESAELVVRGKPGAPVSFTTFDMGTFAENKLSTVTVRADDKGLARATFVASAGAINDVNILAASPLASGDVSFKVEVVK
ncbi:MAG: hypothetical protein L6R28_13415 [Planctomycetes bacterium]|nr:hypothetical protein [Planctomycetota bacterium]